VTIQWLLLLLFMLLLFAAAAAAVFLSWMLNETLRNKYSGFTEKLKLNMSLFHKTCYID
jgi:hypothetical protein